MLFWLKIILVGCFVMNPSFKWKNIFPEKNKKSKIVLVKDLEVGGKESDVIFDYLIDLDVDKNNRIYIPDLGTRSIYVFSKKGNLIKKIGRGGKGPGEFQILRDVAISKHRLYVFDPTLFRISVFSLKNDGFELSETIKLPKGPLKKNPAWIWISKEGNLLVSYESSYSFKNLDKKI